MKPETAARHEEIAGQVVRLILEAHGNVSVGVLCAEVGTSETICRGAFLDLTGETIEEFSRRVRLERAACLLSGSGAPVWEIALDCGYSSSSTLDRPFGSHFGCSPLPFRELNPGAVYFPSFAYEYGFEPGRERVDVGVYTGFAQITTFTYDAFRLLEKQTPDGLNYFSARNGNAIYTAILDCDKENKL